MNKKKNLSRTHHPLRLCFSKTTLRTGQDGIHFHNEVGADQNEIVRIQKIVVRLDSIDPQCNMGDFAAQMQYQVQPRLGPAVLHCIGLVRPMYVVKLDPPVGKFKYSLISGHRQFQLFSQAEFEMVWCWVNQIEGASNATLVNIRESDGIVAPLSYQLAPQGMSYVVSTLGASKSLAMFQNKTKKEIADQFGVGTSTVYEHLQKRQKGETNFAERAAAKAQKAAARKGVGSEQSVADVQGNAEKVAFDAQESSSGGQPHKAPQDTIDAVSATSDTAGATAQSNPSAPLVEVSTAPVPVRSEVAPAQQQPSLFDQDEPPAQVGKSTHSTNESESQAEE